LVGFGKWDIQFVQYIFFYIWNVISHGNPCFMVCVCVCVCVINSPILLYFSHKLNLANFCWCLQGKFYFRISFI